MKTSYDILFHIPSLQGGGAERVAVEVARYFAQQGWSVAFFIHHADLDYALPEGVDVFVARKSGHLQRVVELRNLLKQVEVRVILSFLPYANLISLFARLWAGFRVRLIVSEHSSYADFRPSNVKERIKFALLAHLYQRSDVIVAVSSGVADDLRRRLTGAAKDKISVIYNPCYIPDAFVPRLFPDSSRRTTLTVLAVGRLVQQKGFDVLIKAFCLVKQRVPNARLRIVGEGADRAKLEALVKYLCLSEHVTLAGFTRNVADEYRRADLFVCSSRTEGFGNVIVEALSFGLPIVSTACKHGPEEILEGGQYGVLVPVENDEALAEAIVVALRNPVDAGKQLARARDFSLEAIGAQYAKAARFTP